MAIKFNPFTGKLDFTGGATSPLYVLKTGDTMTGKLNLPASTTSNSSLNIPYGVDPTSPNLGDIWTTSTGIRIRRGTSGSPETTTVAVLERNTFIGPQTITAAATSWSVLDVTNTQASGTPSVAATFTATGTAPAVTITQNGNGGGLKIVNPTGTGESLRVEDESPESTPFVVSATGKVGIGVSPDASVCLSLDSTGVKFSDGSIQTTAPTGATPTNIQVFTTPGGTWTKPLGAKKIRVELVGGGGGGGSGRKGALGTNRYGGGGGGAAAVTVYEIDAASIISPVTVLVGAGGPGGASITTNDTNGALGASFGGTTSFGLLRAAGGNKGNGGTTTTGTAGSLQGIGVFVGGAGGAGSSGGGTLANSGAYTGGGGGGAGLTAAELNATGGTGGAATSYNQVGAAGGTSPTPHNLLATIGLGGGGGNSNNAGNGGAGGAGGLYGGGGGGGAGATNDVGNSGAGGAGGDGIAIITTYF